MSALGLITVDDTDTVQVTYGGAWRQLNATEGDYMGTAHLATSITASATFVFNGTSVKVFGTIPASSEPPSSQYKLDDHEPVVFAAPTMSSPSFEQQLYASPPLDEGRHTLVIQPTIEGPHFYIDYLQYSQGASASTTAPSSSTTISNSESATASPSNGSRHIDTGKIAGIIVGSVVALGLLIMYCLILFWRRRRRIYTTYAHPYLDTAEEPSRRSPSRTLTPFVPPRLISNTNIPMSYRKLGSKTDLSRSHPRTESELVSTSTQNLSSSSYVSTPTESVESLQPIRHRDAGAAPVVLQRVELPPAYEDRVGG